MTPIVPMRDALSDPALLGGALPGPSWLAWRALLIASMGEALTDEEREAFAVVTGRESEPLAQVDEFWGIAGRRSGKTRTAGTLAAYVGGLCEHDYLAVGERGVIPILASSTSQALRAFMHAKGILQASPELSALIDGEPTSDTIRLATRIDIEVKPANFRTVRGITSPLAIGDEVAFWFIDGSANPDTEILNALRPALATTGGLLWCISSPYAKRGEVYGAFRRDYGPGGDSRVLVAKAASRVFNPSLPEQVVERAYARDAAAAAAEYGAEFRNDLEAFVSREIVEACIARGVRERAHQPGKVYRGFVDPSGGSVDPMTMAIAHKEGDRVVLDVLRERKPPFSPEGVVEEFCATLKAYGINRVSGDRYAGEWAREPFRKRGIAYDLAGKVRSDLYRDLLPSLNNGTAELLDLPVIVNQLAGLERRTTRGGRESIDHAPNSHDDAANAVAGAIDLCMARGLPLMVGAYTHTAPSGPRNPFSASYGFAHP